MRAYGTPPALAWVMTFTTTLILVGAPVVWILLMVLYQLWESRCPVCKSWATQKLDDTHMKCSQCHNTFEF